MIVFQSIIPMNLPKHMSLINPQRRHCFYTSIKLWFYTLVEGQCTTVIGFIEPNRQGDFCLFRQFDIICFEHTDIGMSSLSLFPRALVALCIPFLPPLPIDPLWILNIVLETSCHLGNEICFSWIHNRVEVLGIDFWGYFQSHVAPKTSIRHPPREPPS